MASETPYRKMDVELVPKKDIPTVQIYQVKGFTASHNKHCPFCFYWDHDLQEARRLCSPAKRLWISGWIFRRRYCSIPGWHNHFKCSTCGAHWVDMLTLEPEPDDCLHFLSPTSGWAVE